MTRSRLFVAAALVACVFATSAFATPHAITQSLSRADTQRAKPDPQAETVYVTKTGERYHRESCRSLRKSRIETTVADAKRNGFTACKVCKPPS